MGSAERSLSSWSERCKMRRKATVCGWKLQKKQHLLILFCQCHLRWCCCLYSILLMFAGKQCARDGLLQSLFVVEQGLFSNPSQMVPRETSPLEDNALFLLWDSTSSLAKKSIAFLGCVLKWMTIRTLSILHHLILFRMLLGLAQVL